MGARRVVAASGVTVARGDTNVLADVDIHADAGEVVALVGPNGAGKSTLLSVLAGDERPAQGSVLLDERPVLDWPSVERARRRSVLTQDAVAVFGYRVAEVVAMGRVPWEGTPAAADDDAAVFDAMVATETVDLANRRTTSLSGGELARVALARALAQRCDVMLLDEPTASLDLRHTVLVLEQVRRNADAGAAVIVVLHDLTAAARWADRVVVLDEGRVIGEGPTVDVMTVEVLSRVYRHPIDVFVDPVGGAPVITPARLAVDVRSS